MAAAADDVSSSLMRFSFGSAFVSVVAVAGVLSVSIASAAVVDSFSRLRFFDSSSLLAVVEVTIGVEVGVGVGVAADTFVAAACACAAAARCSSACSMLLSKLLAAGVPTLLAPLSDNGVGSLGMEGYGVIDNGVGEEEEVDTLNFGEPEGNDVEVDDEPDAAAAAACIALATESLAFCNVCARSSCELPVSAPVFGLPRGNCNRRAEGEP